MNVHVPLPAGTVLGKSFEYGVDVNIGTFAVPIWQPIRRMSGFSPTFPPVNTDVATYDDLGAPNSDVTGRGFNASLTVQCNRSLATGLYLPEVELLLAAAKGTLEGAVIDTRYYHKPELGTPNPNDAGRGFATVELTRSNTDNAGIEVKGLTITGKGRFDQIANPFQGWGATAPVITAVGPEGANDGALITITGSGFLGATAVTFDGVAAPDFEPQTGATIIAILPDGAAGSVPVVVTTPGGASAPFAFTRGA